MLWLFGSLLLLVLLLGWWWCLKWLDGCYWLLLGWCLLVLVFFSVSLGKCEVYIFLMLLLLCVVVVLLLFGLLCWVGVCWFLLVYVVLLVVGVLYIVVNLYGGSLWVYV